MNKHTYTHTWSSSRAELVLDYVSKVAAEALKQICEVLLNFGWTLNLLSNFHNVVPIPRIKLQDRLCVSNHQSTRLHEGTFLGCRVVKHTTAVLSLFVSVHLAVVMDRLDCLA